MGSSLRGFDPHAAPYALSSADPLTGFNRIRRSGLTPQGCTHNTKPHRRSRGLVGMPRQLPPWAFPPPRFLASCERCAGLGLTIPSRVFSARSHAGLTADASGFSSHVAQPFSLEIGATSLRFLTSSTLSTLWSSRRTGLWIPLGGRPVSPQTRTTSSPAVGLPAGARRDSYFGDGSERLTSPSRHTTYAPPTRCTIEVFGRQFSLRKPRSYGCPGPIRRVVHRWCGQSSIPQPIGA